MPSIDRLSDASSAERDAITAPLDAFSRKQGYVWQPEPLVLALRDDAGGIVGGAIGETNWEWLHVRILAVAESLRDTGWGRRLMHELERLAIERGCHAAWVDTFSFQARPFYERIGYRVFGVLPDYPTGHERYFLSKVLAPGD